MAKFKFKTEFIALISGAFGFIAALVWKDAIMAWMAPILATGGGATELTIVAVVVTIIALVAIWLMKRFMH